MRPCIRRRPAHAVRPSPAAPAPGPGPAAPRWPAPGPHPRAPRYRRAGLGTGPRPPPPAASAPAGPSRRVRPGRALGARPRGPIRAAPDIDKAHLALDDKTSRLAGVAPAAPCAGRRRIRGRGEAEEHRKKSDSDHMSLPFVRGDLRRRAPGRPLLRPPVPCGRPGQAQGRPRRVRGLRGPVRAVASHPGLLRPPVPGPRRAAAAVRAPAAGRGRGGAPPRRAPGPAPGARRRLPRVRGVVPPRQVDAGLLRPRVQEEGREGGPQPGGPAAARGRGVPGHRQDARARHGRPVLRVRPPLAVRDVSGRRQDGRRDGRVNSGSGVRA